MDAPPPSRAPAAGGCLIALGAVGGAAIGLMLGQASIGLIAGLMAGVVLAFALFAIERR